MEKSGCNVGLPQRLKSACFEKNFLYFGASPFKKFQKTLILAFEANSALSSENETKIVKITHSAYIYKDLVLVLEESQIWSMNLVYEIY